MKNNRSVNLSEDFLKKHKLSTTKPPKNSLFWKMWDSSTAIAKQALNTNFIQGIKNGDLDPVAYGGFNVSDAYYCFEGAQGYLAAECRATDKTLKDFLYKKYQSYQEYNKTFPQVWHIRDAEGVVPSEICRKYSAFESMVASHKDPIYSLIVMLPCEYLWAWLAEQIKGHATKENLYSDWITGNDDPSGAYAMGNFLYKYHQSYSIDEDEAINLYSKAMNFEQQNFANSN